MESPNQALQPALLLDAPSASEPARSTCLQSLQAQTIPAQVLLSREALAQNQLQNQLQSQDLGVLYLPFAAQLVPSLLENLQHSLEETDFDFLLLSPAQDLPAATNLAQEATLATFCQDLPLPPLYAKPALILELLKKVQAGQSFPELLKKTSLRGLVLHRPWLQTLEPNSLPKLPDLPESSQAPTLHPRLSLQPKFKSYAPLASSTLPAWQKPHPQTPHPTKPLPAEKRPHLIQLLPYLEMGGADKFALDLCEALPRYTHWQVSLLTTEAHPNAWLDRARAHTPAVHELPAYLPPSAFPAAIARHAHAQQADALLITHSFFGYRLLPWLAHSLPELTLADYLHIEHPGWKSGGHPRLSILQQDYLDLTLSSSEHLRHWCQEQGRDPRGQAVVHTNIDTEVWNPADFDPQAIRAEHQVPESHCLILVAMRMVYQKQPELLLDIVTQLEAENLPFTCLICGDGEQFELVQKLHQERGLKQSRLLGAKPNSEVKRLMAAADVFLLPTRMEGIALSLFEAMAMECAPVAAAVGGQAELVSPETGSLIDRSQGREAEQAAYLDALRELIQSPELREQKKRAARAHIESQFSLRQMAEKLGQALDQAPQNRAPRPKLSARQAKTLATEAVEASQLQEQLEAGELSLRKHFMGRITQRDQQLEKLKAKLQKTQTELAELHEKRERKPWRKLERKFRRK